MNIDKELLSQTLARLKTRLLDARTRPQHWTGQLSASALSTATAIFALALIDRQKHRSLIAQGLDWLMNNQNPDGGWGDTVMSQTNISTTMLCWAALSVAKDPKRYEATTARTENWLTQRAGSLEPRALVEAIYENYGADRTFSVPILTMCALAGRLGPEPWRFVKPLPFEFAACPHTMFKWLNLNVVSYALPALIAIGHAGFHKNPPANPLTRSLRRLTGNKTMRILHDIQPPNGGFLEAAPLTSFVVMSLVAAGHAQSDVAGRGVDFLAASVRKDGSWPIDTNLATWLTTLSINALAQDPDFRTNLPAADRIAIRDWLLARQYKTEHPYTHADPGGWAWTDLPGAVPDADDTAGALIALHNLQSQDTDLTGPAFAGVKWLLDLQNRDGGIPTFCKGWGKLPFDRSAPDLTAHALTAWSLWLDKLPAPARKRTENATRKALRYLRRNQRPNGSWVPLWFGNEHAPNHQNPVYGTARVLLGLVNIPPRFSADYEDMIKRATGWLMDVRNEDGSYGGDKSVKPSIEETALALHAMTAVADRAPLNDAIAKAAQWLIQQLNNTDRITPSPIGLYFARLWYYEKLYPLIFATAALQKLKNSLT